LGCNLSTSFVAIRRLDSKTEFFQPEEFQISKAIIRFGRERFLFNCKHLFSAAIQDFDFDRWNSSHSKTFKIFNALQSKRFSIPFFAQKYIH